MRLGLYALLLACASALSGCSHAFGGGGLVVPGMTQTELLAVLGPADYIQTKSRRQAWQYCDHALDEQNDDLNITVWFFDGLVEHMRAYPEDNMGRCEDFIAAFRWEDVLNGQYPANGEYVPAGQFVVPPRRIPK